MWLPQRQSVFLSRYASAVAERNHMAMALTCPDLHAYFLGQWQFTRTMHSADGGLIGNAEGVAHFQAQAGDKSLQYQESGHLHLAVDARVIAFSRRFDYQFSPQQDLLHVLFADGPQQGQSYQYYCYDSQLHALLSLQTHVCARDHYDGLYQFIDEGRFDLHTRIEGPHKDYVLVTHFARPAVP